MPRSDTDTAPPHTYTYGYKCYLQSNSHDKLEVYSRRVFVCI